MKQISLYKQKIYSGYRRKIYYTTCYVCGKPIIHNEYNGYTYNRLTHRGCRYGYTN